MAKILVTGANGFIGKRLIYQLLELKHDVFALVRVKGTEFKVPDPSRFHILYGDIQSPENIEGMPQDLDAAYYLVHSMGSMIENLTETETDIAKKFLVLLEKTSVKQVIFLGGIVENEAELSPHLRSRLAVEKVLLASKIPSTILRASIIIGSGSASFEILRDLVEKLPMMIAPKWVKSYCQPIAIRDVLFYLTNVLLHPQCLSRTFDIGGPDAMTFKEALYRYSAFRHLKRLILDVPVLTPQLSSYWLVLITSVRYSICRYLIESMKHSTRKLNSSIDKILPHACIPFEEALHLAFQKISQNEVVSTWMDSWNTQTVQGDVRNYLEVPKEGCLNNTQLIAFTIPIEDLRIRIWSIGGKNGWHSMNWAWNLRGMIDKLLGGSGLNRGRRHPTELLVGDTIDFWRVLLADQKQGRLILYAEMKLPGEAWLEFEIDSKHRILKQTATFRPKGFWGRLYWHLLTPFHWIIFKNMAKSIASL